MNADRRDPRFEEGSEEDGVALPELAHGLPLLRREEHHEDVDERRVRHVPSAVIAVSMAVFAVAMAVPQADAAVKSIV